MSYAAVLFAAMLVGTLLPTFLVSRLLLWLLRRWDGGLPRIALAHIVSWLVCSLATTATDMAMNGAAFTGVESAGIYALPQAVWLLFDLVRRWLRGEPAGKTRQVSN